MPIILLAEERDADAIPELLGQLGYPATAAAVSERMREWPRGYAKRLEV